MLSEQNPRICPRKDSYHKSYEKDRGRDSWPHSLLENPARKDEGRDYHHRPLLEYHVRLSRPVEGHGAACGGACFSCPPFVMEKNGFGFNTAGSKTANTSKILFLENT